MAAGEQFRPVFTRAGTKYVSVWFLAFRLDQCIREDEGDRIPVSNELNPLHNGAYLETIEVPTQSSDNNDPEEVIFHMDQHELYKSVAISG